MLFSVWVDCILMQGYLKEDLTAACLRWFVVNGRNVKKLDSFVLNRVSKRRAVPVSGADAHHGFHWADEDLAIANFTGAGCIGNAGDDVVDP